MFNWVDYSIICIIGLSLIISLVRGFLREAISLATWLIGFLLALKFAADVQVYVMHWANSSLLSYLIAFIAIFLIVFLIGMLVNFIVHKVVEKSGLGLTDRIIGGLFGLIRGIAIVAVILTFMVNGVGSYQQQAEESLNNSALAPCFQPLTQWLSNFLPQQIRQLSAWVDGQWMPQQSDNS